MSNIIDISQLHFSFKEGRRIFAGIDLRVKPGEYVVITGKSGSGKTTLLRMIQMDIKPDSGKISVAGYDADSMSGRNMPKFRRKVGVVYQDFRLIKNMTVFDNVALALKIRGIPSKQIKARVIKTLFDVGLSHAAHLYPEEVSGGEKQRAAIARAIIGRPQVLLADEPTALLDNKTANEIFKILHRINVGGTTLVLASHIQAPFIKLSYRVLEVNNGNLIPVGVNED
ncbi:MAG: ATP-binding cassette domain-containing protein [candidate division Zixibacteria bacterium]|nr:ATP-binding cassette domain-containing protein [candidate division Zixibacteria bacterium]